MTAQIQLLAVASLHESPFNYRRTYNDANLQELAESIKHEGVLSPLLVRPHRPNPLFKEHHPADGFEVVFGHRRLRASKLAALEAVRCEVREMTDEQVKRAQIAENLQREDVHPIEEAEGFQALIDDHGMTADAIAEQIGMSRSYVYGRLKLLAACPQVRTACLAGEIGSEVALLFSRHDPKLQAKALEKLKSTQFYRARNGYTDGGKEGFRAVREFLNEYFMLDLKEALWPLDDAELLPSAGACTTCPKRAGCSPEIFSDVIERVRSGYRHKGGENVCSDPDCFADKKKAQLKRSAAALEAKGQAVIAGAKARQIIGADGAVKGGYVEASKVRDLIKKAKANVTIATAQNPRDGKTKQVVKLDDLKAAGVKVAEPKQNASGRGRDYEAERAREDKKAEEQTKVNRALLKRVRDLITPESFGAFELRMAAEFAFDMQMHGEDEDALCDLYGVETILQLEKRVKEMSPGELGRLLLDCSLVVDVDQHRYSNIGIPERLHAAIKHYGIDVAKVRAEVTGVVPTPPSAARAPKRAAAGAKKRSAAPTGKEKKALLVAGDPNAPVEPELAGQDQTDDAGDAGAQTDLIDALEGADA